MPSLDVNMVLTDPDLADTFDVRRCNEAVGGDGRVVQTFELVEGLVGVVKWDTGKTQRGSDGAISPESIDVYTPFSLRDASFGYQPDVVLWRGAEYKVMKTNPNRHFGEGFTIGKCVSTRAMDNPAPD